MSDEVDDPVSELEQCFERVRDSANAALAHYQIWFALRGKGNAIDTHYDVMNDYRYVDYFHAANSGHYKMMFIEVGCLFDSDDRASSFRVLRGMLEEAGEGDLAKELRERLVPFTELVKNMKTIRSKLIAHKEHSVDPPELYKKYGIKPDDIGSMLNVCVELLGKVENALFGQSSSSSVVSTDRFHRATFALLDVLKAGRS